MLPSDPCRWPDVKSKQLRVRCVVRTIVLTAIAMSLALGGAVALAQNPIRSANEAAVPQCEIDISGIDVVTVGPMGCPVLLAGTRVWHLQRNEEVQAIDVELSESMHRRLSGNGQWFAHTTKGRGQDDSAIRVWNCVTGKVQCEIPGEVGFTPSYMEILLNSYVVLGGRESNQVRIWDIASGELLKTIETNQRRVDEGSMAFSSDATYYAVESDGHLVAFKTEDNKPICAMSSPKEREYKGRAIQMRDNRVVSDTRRGDAQSRFVFSKIESMAFSPDDKELAIISTFPSLRLIVWDQHGQVTFDELIETKKSLRERNSLQWLPDRSGWWIGARFYDRERKRVIFRVEDPFRVWLVVHPLSRTRIITILKSNTSMRGAKITTVELPWDELGKGPTTLPIVLE